MNALGMSASKPIPSPSSPPVRLSGFLCTSVPRLRERERDHGERDPGHAQADRAEHEQDDEPTAAVSKSACQNDHSQRVSAMLQM